MTQIQKEVKELIAKYLPLAKEHKRPMYYAKKCALIAVDEILESMPTKPSDIEHGNIYDDMTESMKYWRQVKKELEK